MPSLPSLTSKHSRRDVVGLDIEPGFACAAQVHVNGGVSVQRAAGVSLGTDVVRDGEVLDIESLSDSLRNLFRDSGLGRNVRIGLANQRTVLRTLDLPPIEDSKELAAAVRFQAEDEVPMPLSNAVLDFQPLGVANTPEGPRQRIVLVAAQRDMVERLLDAVRQAGLRPVGVDLAAFAMIRSLYKSEAGPAIPLVYLSVGGLTNMGIAEGPVCRFTRMLGGGLEAMASSLASRREMSIADAHVALHQVGLPVQSEPAVAPVAPTSTELAGQTSADAPAYSDEPTTVPSPSAGEPGGIEDDVHLILGNGVREIAGEVRNSLDFHRVQVGGEPVAGLVLSGAALEVPGFAGALERELGLPVRAASPEAVEGKSFEDVSLHRLAVAAGLAVEEVPA